MLVVKNSAKQIFVCLFLALFGPYLEKIAYGPLRPPPGPHGLLYYQKGMSQKDNQLWQSTFESKTHNRYICLIKKRSAYCHQSNVPPETAVSPQPWLPWLEDSRTGAATI